MDYGNYWLTDELQRLRRDEIQREVAHERFLAQHGLDLWSVVRAAIGRRLLRRHDRSVEVARAARPVGAAHRALPRGAHLIEPEPAGARGDMRDTAA